MPPKKKRGRPFGSKTKPQWLRDEIAKLKKQRGKGRPKGSKNKPKTLEDFFLSGLAVGPEPPPIKPKVKRKPTGFAALPKEYRQERMREVAKLRPGGKARPKGAPAGWKTKEFLRVQYEAEKEATRIYKMLEDNGLLPEDEMAKECLKTAFQIVKQPGGADLKLKAIKTILEYTKAKPAAKSDITVRTAEDFLDELVAKSDGS